MKTPELSTKIYFTILDMGSGYVYTPSLDDNGGTEYIRKDALLEWAKNLKERWEEPPMSKHSPGCVYMLEQLIDKLNSWE